MRAVGRKSRVCFSVASLWIGIAGWGWAEDADQLWKRVEEAYARNEFENGHAAIEGLLASRPGDDALAARALARMLEEARRQRWHHRLLPRENPRAVWAAQQYCALERRGAVSAHTEMMRLAVDLVVQGALAQGQTMQAHDLVTRLRKKYPQELYWKLSEAELFRALGAPGTTLLYAGLEDFLGGVNTEEIVAERLADNDRARRNWRSELRPPLGNGVRRLSLSLIDGPGVSRDWENLVAAPPHERPEGLHRMLVRSSAINLVPWSDGTGSIDLPLLMDQYLLQATRVEREDLRALQNEKADSEDFSVEKMESELLGLVRSYPWARKSEDALLRLGNRYFWAGRMEAAGRCFQEVVDRTERESVRKQAQVTLWLAKVRSGVLTRSDQILDGIEQDELFPWRGGRLRAQDLTGELLKERSNPLRAPSVASLRELTTRELSVAEPSLWPGQLPATIDLQWMPGERLLVSGRTILSLFDRSDLSSPRWSTPQPLVGDGINYHPGYFRPAREGNLLYLRAGDRIMPNALAAIALETGRPEWSCDLSDQGQGGRFLSPLGDPVLSDGYLFSLHWNLKGGRSLVLTCFDPRGQRTVWQQTVVGANGKEDRKGSLRQASPHRVIFGNRVTVSGGAVYSASNCGVVARSDIRDGRTEWIHNYESTGSREPRVGRLGAAPVVLGDLVICMPRDARSVFALQAGSGRLVWENSLLPGAELVGRVGDLIVVRGGGVLAGLETRTGITRWYRPIERVVGRCELAGSAVFLGQPGGLYRIDGRNGAEMESRPWGLESTQVLAFTVRGRELIVVTDRITRQRDVSPSFEVEWHGAYRPEIIMSQWMEGRRSAQAKLPPEGSLLKGFGYGHSEGLLQCLEIRPGGGLRWERRSDAWSPEFHFVGTRLLLIDRVNRYFPGLPNRVRAYDGKTGRPLWTQRIPRELNRVIPNGDVVLFYRENHRLLAIAGKTGEKLWERRFLPAERMCLQPGDDRLHVVTVSRVRTVSHLEIDLLTGRTLSEDPLGIPRVEGEPKGAVEAPRGYLEVTFLPRRGRYLRLVALSEVNNQDFTTIADLQVLGADGEPLPRDQLRIHSVDSYANSGFEDPENAIDEDIVTWWHTPWRKKGYPLPHEIQLDLGEEVAVTGIRYLPATISNSKGMIKEFEIHVTGKAGPREKPVARGIMSARPRIGGLYNGEGGAALDVRYQFSDTGSVLRYGMDGEGLQIVREHARIVRQSGGYYVSNTLDDGSGNHFVVHRFDDPSYAFDLGTYPREKSGGLKMEGDLLTMGPQQAIQVDLREKRFLRK